MTDVWLDTSIVLTWNPRLDSVGAHNFFKYARAFQHSVFLNEIVLRELTKQHMDRATEWTAKHEKLNKDLARLALPVSLEIKGTVPTDLEEYYRNLLINQCREKSITITPLHPELEGKLIQRVLQMAIQHQPPFQGKKSRAFKDVLIVLSTLDYARQHGKDRVIFLAGDNDFTEESITALSDQYGVKFEVFESVPDFTAYFDKLLDAKMRMEKEEQEKRVRSFLLSQKDIIISFISSNFDTEWLSPTTRLALALDAYYGVKSIWPEKITIVTLTSEPSEQEGVTTLFITFEVTANVQLGPRKLWIDGEVEPSYIIHSVEPSTVHGFGGLAESLEHREKIRVECEATAAEDAAGKLANFQMKSARLKGRTREVQEGMGVVLSDRAIIEKIEGQPPPNAD